MLDPRTQSIVYSSLESGQLPTKMLFTQNALLPVPFVLFVLNSADFTLCRYCTGGSIYGEMALTHVQQRQQQ